uniref:DnaJ heat shock protein family (Hsp40) member C2 n=1 Tax=Rousettus aegyptiacus TaxID=9407 RepID=A0A7J8D5C9_ROUAE|nr:DnaJ heat shock protein family (Hsp40) member C2 [Rousettus aegyptiacus]
MHFILSGIILILGENFLI